VYSVSVERERNKCQLTRLGDGKKTAFHIKWIKTCLRTGGKNEKDLVPDGEK
jgi:hypothetical protein